eukprot:TRINITY_DN7945_c0_g1_i11.p1 TRINITY_DN7945_c0_g1~~TRINITY_DN7945_c0_g1_i11.p1  ORF type:complete len:328 (-),score=45.65 TRINITY_DN7945_c0_g1_i11:125-1108(-)
MRNQDNRKKKLATWQKLWSYLDDYKQILIIDCNHMSATLLQEVREVLRPFNAVLLIDKNTMIKAGIRKKMERPKKGDKDYKTRQRSYRPIPELEKLIELCSGNVGLIFCKDRLFEIKNKLKNFREMKKSRVGYIAPHDFVVHPGPVNTRHSYTTLFDDLTEMCRNYKIIVKEETEIVRKGKRINSKQHAYLENLMSYPFTCKLSIPYAYDNGFVYDASVLDIGKKGVIEQLRKAANELTAISLHIGYLHALAIRQSISFAFRNMVAFALATDYDFEQSLPIKEKIRKIELAKQEAEEVEERKRQETERQMEEELFIGMDLFGDYDEY